MKIKNEAELLSIFCDESYSNPLRHSPFFNTKYNEVWSTDGYSLIRVKPERLIGEYPKGELNLPPLECPCKKKITIEAINKALGECPKVDEEIITQDAIECKECDGSGEVYWEYTDNNGQKLKFAMNFLGITYVELIFNHYGNAGEFVIDEDIRIELASMLFDHTCECDAKLELIQQ